MAKQSKLSKKCAAAPAVVRDALLSHSRPLRPDIRTRMEDRFQFNFCKVRVHEGELANRSAQSLDALAYTVGNHIVFANGTAASSELLAHELAHVRQNNSAAVTDYSSLQVAPDWGVFEQDASSAAQAVGRGSRVLPQAQSSPGYVRRRTTKKRVSASGKEIRSEPTEEEKERIEQQPLLTAAVAQVYSTKSAEPLLETLDLTGEAAEIFKSTYHAELVPWLTENMTDRSKLVRSVAIVLDGLDWPLHAIMASATLGEKVLEAPPALLDRLKIASRQQVKSAYSKTYIRPKLSMLGLEQDLLDYYGQLNKPDYQKSIALLHHELTSAERLFFLGTGQAYPEVPRIVSLINDLWLRDGAKAISELETNWSRYVQNHSHWLPKGGYWSEYDLYDALQRSLKFKVLGVNLMSEWGNIEPFLRAIAEARQGQGKYGYMGIGDDIEGKLKPVLEVMEKSRRLVDDRESMRQALMLFHQIFRDYIAKAKSDKDREYVRNYYRARLAGIELRFFERYSDDRTVAPLFVLNPTLADEFYSLLYPGFTSRAGWSSHFSIKDFTAIQSVMLKAWAEGGGRIDEMIEDAMHEKRTVDNVVVRPMFSPVSVTRGLSFFPGLGPPDVTDLKRKRVITLVDDVSNALRGMHCLQVELNPNIELSEALKNRPSTLINVADTDLEPVYTLLTTSGISVSLRNDVIRSFVEKTRAGDGAYDITVNGRRSDPRTFLAYLTWLTDGERGNWFYRIQALIDPTLDAHERLSRMELRAKAGSNWFSAGLSDLINEANRQDPREAVRASMAAVKATTHTRQSKRLIALYAVKDLEELAGIQDSEFESRVTALHASEELVNAMVQKSVEWVIEGALCAALGPAWWAQLIAAVTAKMVGMGGRELLSGTRYKLESRENVKELLMTALGTLLVDPINIRGRLGEVWKPEQARIFSRLKPNNADFVGQILLNGATGAVESVLTILPIVALDVFLLNQDWDQNAMSSAANVAFSQIFGKAALPFLGSTKINPQAINDLTSASDNFKINILFKMMLAVPSAAKRIGDDSAKDDYFDVGDLLSSAGVAFGQKMGAAFIRGSGNAVARIRVGRKNVAQVAAIYGPASHRTEEAYRVIGTASRADPKIGEALNAVTTEPLHPRLPPNPVFRPMRLDGTVYRQLPEAIKVHSSPPRPGPRQVVVSHDGITTRPLKVKGVDPEQLSMVRLQAGNVYVQPHDIPPLFYDPANLVTGVTPPIPGPKPLRAAIPITKPGATDGEITLAVGKRRVAEADAQLSGKDAVAIHKILLAKARERHGEVSGTVFGSSRAIPYTQKEAASRVAADLVATTFKTNYGNFLKQHLDATPELWIIEHSRSNPKFLEAYQNLVNIDFRSGNLHRKVSLN